ncbi:MAG: hypothetical protein AB7R55_04995 [Gemmatimonadales bacterium]
MSVQNAKRSFIEAYFEDVEARIGRVAQIAAQGFSEEALILACCHLSGMAQLRYAGGRDDMRLFTRLVRDSGGHGEVYDRVSRREITCWTDKDPFAPKALQEHEAVGAEVAKRFGDEPSVAGDPKEGELLAALKGVPRIDLQNLEANVWRFTYGAILYRRWRSPGVHQGEIDAPWEVESRRKVFRLGDNGERAYYNSFHRLTFSERLVMDTLQRVFEALRAECLEKNVFPPELPQMSATGA